VSSPFDEYPKEITSEVLKSMAHLTTKKLQDDLDHLLAMVPEAEHVVADLQVNMQYVESFERAEEMYLPTLSAATKQLGNILNLIKFLQKVIDARQEAS